MTLIKTSLLNAIAVMVKMLTLLGLNKILAVYVGPAGYAAIGQLQNAIQMILTVSGGALNTGVTKYTAEYGEDEVKQISLWQTAFKINLYAGLSISLLLVLFNEPLALYFLGSIEYKNVFLWFAATIILFVLNSFFIAIVNGKKEIFHYVKINIVGSLVSLLVTGLCAFYFGLYGALIALVTNQSIVFFITLILCRNLFWFKWKSFFGAFDKSEASKLSKFALAALTSAIVVPLSHILVRGHLVDTFGWESAGYWDAMWRISSIYLMFITMTLSVYYLPRLSEITTKEEMQKELLKGYKLIIPILVIISFTIYLLRDFVVILLFSSDFQAMDSLFFWQLIGDTIKIASWLLAYVLLGKAMIKLLIFSELLFAFMFYVLTVIFSNFIGFEGVALAHALNYVFYFIFMFTILRVKKVI